MDDKEKSFLKMNLKLWLEKDGQDDTLNFEKLCSFIGKCHPKMTINEIQESADFCLKQKGENCEMLSIDDIIQINFQQGYIQDPHKVKQALNNLVTFVFQLNSERSEKIVLEKEKLDGKKGTTAMSTTRTILCSTISLANI